MRRMIAVFLVSVALVGMRGLSSFAESAASGKGYVQRSRGTVTFNKDVASIMFEKCAVCHRPGQVTPFTLLSYQSVKKRANQIAVVTANRYMPPWLPEEGTSEFIGERRLSLDQIGVIGQWVAEGAVEGDPADLPLTPRWENDWQHGKPDLLVKMNRRYTLGPAGKDVFRNFVIPAPVPVTRYVKALEFRTDNAKIVHHAVILIDPTRSSRNLDDLDPEVGYDGMDVGQAKSPSGQFLGWTPGKGFLGSESMPWRLEKGTDLVVQLHMIPTGKPETIQFSIGVYFSERPATRTPLMIRIGSMLLDIPAGEKNYMNRDEYVLPVDVEVLGVYPHAHYLAREMKGLALLPDGTTQWLIRINEWDFNWQDEYRYVQPISLPRGTTLVMEYTHDNSSHNVRNPHDPPRRVVYGPNTADEMGDLWLQVLPRQREDLAVFEEDFMRREREANIVAYRKMLQDDPQDPEKQNALAVRYQVSGRLEEAIFHFREAIRLNPTFVESYYNLAIVLQTQGKLDEAIHHYRQALKVKPKYAIAHNNLAVVLQIQGKLDEAIHHYRQVAKITPGEAEAYYNLGIAFRLKGELEQAVSHYRQALQVRPEHVFAHVNLGEALAAQGKLDEAADQYTEALRIAPDDAKAHSNAGLVLTRMGQLDGALKHFREVARLKPSWPSPWAKIAWILTTHPDATVRAPDQAVQFAEQAVVLSGNSDPEVLYTLAMTYAGAGRFDRAVKIAESAYELARVTQADELAQRIVQGLELYKQGRVGGQSAVEDRE